jgi:hypothetical protein
MRKKRNPGILIHLFAGVGIVVGLASLQTLAWGPAGHMTVGSIADGLIAGTNTAKQVRKILGTNLRTAAVWADCAKGVNPKTFKYEGEGKFPECKIYENSDSEKMMEAFVKRNVGNCISPPDAEVCHKQYHYTDVAIQRNAYMQGKVGTSDHDIVSAVSAAISVLLDKGSPQPFQITSKKEAIRVLAHYVGDIHQPLHVAAVYIDPSGHVVDPDMGVFNPRTETHGGNDLFAGTKKLHGEWDTVTGSFTSESPSPAVLMKARSIPVTAGPISGWSTIWATETLLLGKQAFNGITYSSEAANGHYKITLPPHYDTFRISTQQDQVIKAGARLAQILKQIWPE